MNQDVGVFALVVVLIILAAFEKTEDIAIYMGIILLLLVWWKAYVTPAPNGSTMLHYFAQSAFQSVAP